MTRYLDRPARPSAFPDDLRRLLVEATTSDDSALGPALDLLDESGFGDVAEVGRAYGPGVVLRMLAFLDANHYDPDRMALIVRRGRKPMQPYWLVYEMVEVRPHSYWLFALHLRATSEPRR